MRIMLNVPTSAYEKLAKQARDERRPLKNQAVHIIEQAVKDYGALEVRNDRVQPS